MKKSVFLPLCALAIGVGVVLGMNVSVQTAVAEDAPAVTAETTEAAPVEAQSSAPTGDAYRYVAQPGDSFSVLARKAVQTYGIDSQTNLSGAQIIFAETNLTKDAGWPILNEGQEVTMSKEAVKAWVEKAKELTGDAEAAWQVYVPFVDFNTNAAGEAKQA